MSVGHYDAPVAVEHGVGVVSSGVGHAVVRHRDDRSDGTARPLVWCHSAGANQWTWPYTGTGTDDLLNWGAGLIGLAGGRYILIAAQGGDDSWSNDLSIERHLAALTWLQSAEGGGARPGKAGMLGHSMGGITALNVARALGNDRVAGVLGLHPTADLDWHRGIDGAAWPGTFDTYDATQTQGPFYGPINLAHGIATDAEWAAISPDRNPVEFVPAHLDVAYLALYNSGDAIIGAASLSGVGDRIAHLATRFTRGEARAVSASASHNEIFSTPLDAIEFLDSLPWG